MSRPIRVRDFRNKQFFQVDDVYLNGYSKHLGVTASMVYIALCRHADKSQVAFPSQETIAEKLGIGLRTVVDKIALLIKWKLIHVERERSSNGKWLRNTYVLTDKSEWGKLPGAESAHGEEPSANNYINQVQPLHTKDTQYKKDTHISLYRRASKLSTLNDKHFQEIADKYGVPVDFVVSKYDDLINYCSTHGKSYKNYYSALSNWVKRDAIDIKSRHSQRNKKTAIDATGI